MELNITMTIDMNGNVSLEGSDEKLKNANDRQRTAFKSILDMLGGAAAGCQSMTDCKICNLCEKGKKVSESAYEIAMRDEEISEILFSMRLAEKLRKANNIDELRESCANDRVNGYGWADISDTACAIFDMDGNKVYITHNDNGDITGIDLNNNYDDDEDYDEYEDEDESDDEYEDDDEYDDEDDTDEKDVTRERAIKTLADFAELLKELLD